MHDHDPYNSSPPLVPTSPGVDPTTGPILPIVDSAVVEREQNFNPFPYIAVLVLSVLGIWGLMSLNRRDDTPRVNDVAYVEQTLEPKASPDMIEPPLKATNSRMAEDKARDAMVNLQRDEVAASTQAAADAQAADDAARIDDYAAGPGDIAPSMPAYGYDNEVASVDLTASTPSPTASATMPPSPDVAVLDLDYSDRRMVALSEVDLRNSLGALEADMEKAEVQAQEVGQMASHEILEERLDLIEDMMEAKTAKLSDIDRLGFTRQIQELRDELTAFQDDLAKLVAAR